MSAGGRNWRLVRANTDAVPSSARRFMARARQRRLRAAVPWAVAAALVLLAGAIVTTLLMLRRKRWPALAVSAFAAILLIDCGEEAYEELYPTRDMPTSGSFHPRGRAVEVPGGYLVSGRWD